MYTATRGCLPSSYTCLRSNDRPASLVWSTQDLKDFLVVGYNPNNHPQNYIDHPCQLPIPSFSLVFCIEHHISSQHLPLIRRRSLQVYKRYHRHHWFQMH